MREGLGDGIYPWVMARGIFESGKGSFQKLQGRLKKFLKDIFPGEKHFGLSPNKRGKPPRPKSSFE